MVFHRHSAGRCRFVVIESMIDANVFTDEAISSKVFSSVGMVRIPVSVFNSSIYDLIRVYARQFLSAEDYSGILNSDLEDLSCSEEYDDVSLYMYSGKNYNEFLKMAIREHYSADDGFEDTLSATMLYCDDDEVNYDFDSIPIITPDSSLSIESYKAILPSNALSLIRVDTMLQHYDQDLSTISEYILYIPYI